MVTIRLSPAAGRNLDAICREFACVPRDVIERLLLGAAYEAPARAVIGLSADEARFAELV